MSNYFFLNKTQLYRAVMAFIAGALCTLGFAPFDVYPLGMLAPALFIFLWQYSTRAQASWFGFCFGMGLFGTGVHWIFYSMYLFTSMPTALSAIFTIGFICYLSLFPALTAYACKSCFPDFRPRALLFGIPAVWVFFEWVRSWFLSGFPWLLLGYTQTQSPLAHFATYFSVYGVSLLCVMAAGCLLLSVRAYLEKNYTRAFLSLLALFSLFVIGSGLSFIRWTHSISETWKIALVQGNIPQEEKWSSELLSLSLDRYDQLSKPLLGKVDLIIWPETAIPLGLQTMAPWIETLDQTAKKNRAQFIVGIPIETKDQTHFYNGIVTLGDQHSVYLKRRLVPFGEFIPFEPFLAPLMKKLNIPLSDLKSGFNPQPLQFKSYLISASICYEVAFPELIWTRNSKISALLTISNDAWFGPHSIAQSQHLEITQMRAIELQRPALLVGNSGKTAFINDQGKVYAELPTDIDSTLISTLSPKQGLTPWQVLGMDGVLSLLLIFFYLAYRDQSRYLGKSTWTLFGFIKKIYFPFKKQNKTSS